MGFLSFCLPRAERRREASDASDSEDGSSASGSDFSAAPWRVINLDRRPERFEDTQEYMRETNPGVEVRLVERYDAVKFCIFQRNLSNFRGLVLFCIEADFCNQILIF